MTSRAGLRFLHTGSRAFRTAPLRQTFQRRVTTTADSHVAQPNQGYLSRLWHSPVGPKTVHFWAPVMKWGLVIAGISDLSRPAESLSLTQNVALMCTGMIWTRWCFVIRPQNYFLAAVNFFLFCTGATQVTRIFLYHRRMNDTTLAAEMKKAVTEAEHMVENIAKDPQASLKEAMRTGD